MQQQIHPNLWQLLHQHHTQCTKQQQKTYRLSEEQHRCKAVPWLRWLVSSSSLYRPGFSPRPIHVEFVVDKKVLGHISLWILQFSPILPSHWCSMLIVQLLLMLHNLSNWQCHQITDTHKKNMGMNKPPSRCGCIT